MTASDRPWRAVGFLLLVLGFGLRLDTRWQGLAWVLLLAGGVAVGYGLWLLSQRSERSADAFVREEGKG